MTPLWTPYGPTIAPMTPLGLHSDVDDDVESSRVESSRVECGWVERVWSERAFRVYNIGSLRLLWKLSAAAIQQKEIVFIE